MRLDRAVRAGLRRVGRDGPVEDFWDDLSVGPLRDVDRGGASRIAWWSKVEGRKPSARDTRMLDDRAIGRRIVQDHRNVVLWYGPHPTEFLYALRACWMLRRTPEWLYEVRLPRHPNPALEPFYGAVGIVGPERVVRGWPTLRRARDVSRRAERWVALRSNPGDTMRLLDGWRVREHPISFRDAELLEHCGVDWSASMNVLARGVARGGPTGDGVLCWRIRELLRAGVLEGRGRRTRIGLPTELRLSPAHPAAAPGRRGRDSAR